MNAEKIMQYTGLSGAEIYALKEELHSVTVF